MLKYNKVRAKKESVAQFLANCVLFYVLREIFAIAAILSARPSLMQHCVE